MGTAAPQPHILLIDGAPDVLDVMAEVLLEEGYRVTVSLAPLAAPDLSALAPDLIVQDLVFGGHAEAGWNILTLAHLDPALAAIPRILCTAASERVREPNMAANLDRLGIRVLLKPFRLEDLLAAVADALAAQRLLDQVRSQYGAASGSAETPARGGSGLYASSPAEQPPAG